MDIFRTPLLTAREVARHLEMPETTLDRWIRMQAADAPLIHAVKPVRRGWPRMPFVAIIEAHVLRTLREAGFHLADIERAAAVVRQEFGDEYALATKRIATDGVKLFVKLANDELIHPTSGQLAIPEVIDEHLRFISWDEDGLPERLRLKRYGSGADVIIDPRFGWGAPVLEESKIPIGTLKDLWVAGEPMEAIAEEFELSRDLVEDVLRSAAA